MQLWGKLIQSYGEAYYVALDTTSKTGRYDRSFALRTAFPSSSNLRQFKNRISKIYLGSS
ncbi:unnamed protein product [Acanthoscelides obtectus]|uniref:Uncharacterized protein n=1 Tax=Acanthoscelides obtectus TaxID=200917 RepID=A0A9P0NVC0_ACAOB|nr:unnamed protein product [Acanthoscelides obtectus]CAK1628875.1 hypothetical protein AOBTE_LOCUS5448 [Acanthoscelides obtectus]